MQKVLSMPRVSKKLKDVGVKMPIYSTRVCSFMKIKSTSSNGLELTKSVKAKDFARLLKEEHLELFSRIT